MENSNTSYLLQNYEPATLFRFFEEISAIPRGSGNEKGIADYLCRFAEARGLRYYRDALHNVILYKAPSPGYENEPAVALQGHTDMVCEKNAGTVHDFEKDPLSLVVEDGWLRADGTTLGGDDGAAVAIMLAILADDTLPHPALECIFTVQEETGLGGASFLDGSKISAKKMINLDSEEEGVAVASCAGSLNTHFLLSADEVPFAGACLQISISGLKGGHSGSDIDAGRQNAVLLMGRLLSMLYREEPFNLLSLSGGGKRNAIPRECEAVIAVQQRDSAAEKLKALAAALRPELCAEDAGLRVKISKHPAAETMQSYKATSSILSFLSLLPNGVLSMSASRPGLVESSSNLGIASSGKDGFRFDVYSRSSVEPVMDKIEMTLERLAKVTGLSYHFEDRAPGWRFEPDSALQKDFLRIYRTLFPDAPAPSVTAIHAGLECGILLERIGGGDAISIGPRLEDIHTPSERMELASFARVYRLTAALIAEKKN